MTPHEIAAAIRGERERQHLLWHRVHPHGFGDCSSQFVSEWVKSAVLTEEVGEVAKALLEQDREGLRRELVQVAAVAHAWLESL